jgi:O-antigen ligase
LVLRRRFVEIGLPLIGIGIAALWPLTAYGLNPLLFPILLVLGAVVLTVVTRPEFGLALAVALSPLIGLKLYSSPAANIPLPEEPFRILVPLIVFGVLLYGVLARGLDRRGLPGVFAGIALLIVAAIASTFQAIDPSEAVVDIFLLLTAAALFVAILNICQTRDQLLVVVAGTLAALLIVSIHGIGQQISGVYSSIGFVSDGESVGRVQGSFGHPNEYAGFVAMLIPLAVAVAVTRQLPARLRLLAGTAAVAAVPALIYSYSRGALATLIIGSLLWLAFLRPRLVALALVVIVVAAISAAPGTVKERFEVQSAEAEFALRPELWKSALDIYADRPLLGAGVNNFSLAYAELPSTELHATQKYLLHREQLLTPEAAPSQYLNTLAEQGLIGFTALVAFLALAIRTGYRVSKARDPAVQGLGLGIGMAISTVAVYSVLYVTVQGEPLLPLAALLAVAATAEAAFRPRPEQVEAG